MCNKIFKMKQTIRLSIVCIAIIAISAIGINISFGERQNSVSMRFFNNIESLADPENTVDYSKGYVNNPESCTVTETVECSIPIYIPVLKGFCTVGFSYTLDYEGTRNYCTYTGGDSGCSFHECKKNDSN